MRYRLEVARRALIVFSLGFVGLSARAEAPVRWPGETVGPAWPPNFSRSVQGSGLPGVDGGHVFLWNRPEAFDPAPTLRVDRHVPEGSGEATHTYKALWALGSSGPHNAGYEWTITGELHNRALASTGAQNVAVNGTIFKEANGLGPVGPSWAGNFNCVDTTDEARSTSRLSRPRPIATANGSACRSPRAASLGRIPGTAS
jgi:hypothetical protein